MCGTCGCGQPDGKAVITLAGQRERSATAADHSHPAGHHHHDHGHAHAHAHAHAHDHHHHRTIVEVEQDILHANEVGAARNRGFFEGRGIVAINLVSSPGSGKTTLLEKTLARLKDRIPCYVIEGDQQTMHDADRIAALEVPVVQVNTGRGCHLESDMIFEAVRKLNPTAGSLLFIENVGNLVCPSLFDLGERRRVVIISVTEGEDKPLKYPDMFHSSHVCIINKTDLLPYVDVDVEKIKAYARQVNPHLRFFELSAATGEGLDAWLDWLGTLVPQKELR